MAWHNGIESERFEFLTVSNVTVKWNLLGSSSVMVAMHKVPRSLTIKA